MASELLFFTVISCIVLEKVSYVRCDWNARMSNPPQLTDEITHFDHYRKFQHKCKNNKRHFGREKHSRVLHRVYIEKTSTNNLQAVSVVVFKSTELCMMNIMPYPVCCWKTGIFFCLFCLTNNKKRFMPTFCGAQSIQAKNTLHNMLFTFNSVNSVHVRQLDRVHFIFHFFGEDVHL